MGKKANAIIEFGGVALATALAGCYSFQKPEPSNVINTQILQERITSNRNIAYIALDIEREEDLGVTGEDYQLLDKILDTAKARITVKQTYSRDDAHQILNSIADIISEFGFEFFENPDTFSYTLKTKKIDCHEYTLLYLAIAEHLGIPLKGVNAPQHIFVRFVLNYDENMNWECTSRQELSNEDYIKWLNIHPNAIRNGAALRTLDRQQIISHILTEKGDIKSDKGDLEGAITDYNHAIKLDPNNTAAYYNRGNAKWDKGDLEGAITDYNHAIKLDPNYAAAYYNRGNAKSDKGDLEGAITDYNHAIKLDPNDTAAYYNRGNAKSDKGDLEGAITDYNHAIKLDPNHAKAYNNRGKAKSKKGDLEGAITDYDIAIKLNSNNAAAYYNRGTAYERLGKLEESKRDFETCKRLTKGK